MAESDGELHYDVMVAASNRKQKKSGGFQAMGLDSAVNKGIIKRGYRAPTPIQRKAVPLILSGKDVVGMARTGSGKTAAFLIPLFQKMKQRSTTGTRALLISPTRELALQTFKFTKEIGKYTGLLATVLVGGDSMEEQFSALHNSPDIVIATPGRLLHVVMEMNLKLNHISYVVFDEADRLFEMGFGEQLHEVLKRLPAERQTVMFSATLPKSLVDFARAGLTDPALVRLDVDSKISDKLAMRFICCRSDDKMAILLYLLNHVISSTDSTLIFAATKHHVEYTRKVLELCGFPSSYLYSTLDPEARKININAFRAGKVKILLVTDLAARGVDIPLLDNVINLHFPAKPKLFVHRVGRVARAGRSGNAYSLIGPEEVPYLIDLHLFLGRPILFGNGGNNGSENDDNSAIGEFPRQLMESEVETLRSCDQFCSELELLKKTADNAYKQYCRSRPSASIESIRRSKQDSRWRELPCHPLFSTSNDEVASSIMASKSVLNGLKNYKPQLTIFELNKGSKTSEWMMMKAKRRVHKMTKTMAVTPTGSKDSDGEVESVEGPSGAYSGGRRDETSMNSASLDITDSSIPETFDEIVTECRRMSHSNQVRRKGRKWSQKTNASSKDDSEYFIPYRPRDFHSEQGLAVEKASSFEQAANSAVLDLMADEGEDMRDQKRKSRVWDRRKKRFIGNPESGNKVKKFRTESGVWLSTSYRSGIYEKWKKQNKVAERDTDSDENDTTPSAQRHFGNRIGRSQRGRGRVQKTHQQGLPQKRELKNPEEILKKRKRKQRIQSYQKYRHQQKMHKGKKSTSRDGGRKRKGK